MPSDSSLSRSEQKCLWLCFILFCLAGAINILEVHTHHGLIGGAVYCLLLAPFAYWLLFRSHGHVTRKVLASLWLWLVIVAILGVADERHNLKADAAGMPMSTSLALEYPARALLLHGRNMYSVTAAGAPISPGPGWILLWSPLTLVNGTGFLCAVALICLLVLIYRRNPAAVGLFAILMLAQPLFLSQMANGQDLFAISMAIASLVLLLERFNADVPVALLGVFGGIVATSRVPMIAIIVVLGIGVWKRSPRAGAIFLATSTAVALGFHAEGAYFAHRAGNVYQPMHVLGRAASAGVSRLFGVGLLAAGLLLAIWRIRATAISWILCCFLSMAVLFTPEGIGEYFRAHRWDWEGANYISFPIPLLLLALALSVSSRSSTREDAAAQGRV